MDEFNFRASKCEQWKFPKVLRGILFVQIILLASIEVIQTVLNRIFKIEFKFFFNKKCRFTYISKIQLVVVMSGLGTKQLGESFQIVHDDDRLW